MAQGYLAPQIYEMHGEEWGVSLMSVCNYCRAVRRSWRDQALSDEDKLDRAVIREMLFGVIRTAYELKDTVQVGKDEFEWVRRPDLKAVNTAIKTLCWLDGLADQPEDVGPRDAEVFLAILATGYGVSEERLAPMRAAMLAMSGKGKLLPKGTGQR